MINNHKASIEDHNGIIIEDNIHGEWKIRLPMQIDFISLETGEIRTMYSKSNNVEIMMRIETDDIINKLFESFLEKYQKGLETKMKGSQFVLENVNFLYYSLHKISLNRGGSYTDSPEWLKNKGATINPQNKDNDCFKYPITVASNHEKTLKNPQRISKVMPFIDHIIGRG